MTRRSPHPRSTRHLLAVLLVALAVSGCGRTGEETTRIDEAEAEVLSLVDDMVEALELPVVEPPTFGRRERCELVTGVGGAASALRLRTPLPSVDDPLGRAAAVLVGGGYQLIEGQLDEGVFGRRDGIRITVVPDPPTGELAIDAGTGCRPLPAS